MARTVGNFPSLWKAPKFATLINGHFTTLSSHDRLNLSFVKDMHVVGKKMTRKGRKTAIYKLQTLVISLYLKQIRFKWKKNGEKSLIIRCPIFAPLPTPLVLFCLILLDQGGGGWLISGPPNLAILGGSGEVWATILGVEGPTKW